MFYIYLSVGMCSGHGRSGASERIGSARHDELCLDKKHRVG